MLRKGVGGGLGFSHKGDPIRVRGGFGCSLGTKLLEFGLVFNYMRNVMGRAPYL